MSRMWPRVAFAVLTLAVLATGCASRNVLAEYQFRGRTLGARMRTPPEPRVMADISLRVDSRDPVGTVFRLGTGIAKAAQVAAAQERMEKALQAVDLPGEVRRTALEECAYVLAADPVGRASEADYLLDLEIREYGIEAKSWNSQALFTMELSVELRDAVDGGLIWRAHLSERSPIAPSLFSVGGAVGNMVTAVSLSELSEEDIGRGLMKLAARVATRSADLLERDLSRARRG